MKPDAALIKEIEDAIARELPSLEELYKHFHANPELSGREEKTSARLEEELKAAGFSTTGGIGGYGVVGVLSTGAGPVVMIRADMDALPVKEETGLPYASRVEARSPDGSLTGVMHACGHDAHITVMAGTARVLQAIVPRWNGTVVMVGQPAEEVGNGAEQMIADGLFEKFPRPDYALALHVGPDLPVGTIGYREGAFSAGSDSMDIIIKGVGGHAAHSEKTRDPVVLAAQAILAFQTIVSRELPANEMGIITVAAVHGGSTHNTIPDQVVLQVNIRYFREEMRACIIGSIRRITRNLALAAGVSEDRMPEIRILPHSVPPLVNDPELMKRVVGALGSQLGDDRVIRIDAVTGSEDFGIFGLQEPKVPLCYFRIGTGTGDDTFLHNSRFAPPPKETIGLGVLSMTIAVLELLEKK